MVRSGSSADRLRPKVRTAATILFAGPMGAGVGIAADIAADVARLSHRTVARRRDFAQAGTVHDPGATHCVPQPIVLQLVSFSDAAHAADSTRIDIVIAWDQASAVALKAAGIEADETLVADQDALHTSPVPTWRRDLIASTSGPHYAGRSRAEAHGLQQSARALKALSRRLPFTRELWKQVLKLHVPARRRREATQAFSAPAEAR